MSDRFFLAAMVLCAPHMSKSFAMAFSVLFIAIGCVLLVLERRK